MSLIIPCSCVQQEQFHLIHSEKATTQTKDPQCQTSALVVFSHIYQIFAGITGIVSLFTFKIS